eukprot:gene1561-3016_t
MSSKKKSLSLSSKEAEKSVGESIQISHLLSTGLIAYPELFDLLPTIINALDNGQVIHTNSISSIEIRNFLEKLFKALPLEKSNAGGWLRKKDALSVSGFIMVQLLDFGSIVQPGDLSQSRSISVRAASYLIDTITSFPSLKCELGPLIHNIIDGSAVDLNGIENEEVSNKLERLFQILDLELIENNDENDGYRIPKKNYTVIKEALENIVQIFDKYEKYSKKMNIIGFTEVEKNNKPVEVQSESGSSSESEDSDASIEEDKYNDIKDKR